MSKFLCRAASGLLGCLLFFMSTAYAGNDKWGELLTQSVHQRLALSDNEQTYFIAHQVRYPSLAILAQARENLAGLTFYTEVAGRVGVSQYSHLSLFKGKANSIDIRPQSGVIIDYGWAPDFMSIALLIQDTQEVSLWLYDIAQQQLRRLSKMPLSARLGRRHLVWLPDSSGLIVKAATPEQASQHKALLSVQVQSSEQQINQGRTYKHLLDDPVKQKRFNQLAQSQLVKIDLQGNSQLLGKAGMIERFAVSPDGRYVLEERLRQQLSPHIPYKKWGRSHQIVSLNSFEVVLLLPDLLDEINLPKAKDSVAEGARAVMWLPFEGATISWTQASDKGIMANVQSHHDIIYQQAAPFTSDKRVLLEVPWRLHDIFWSKSGTGVLQQWRYSDRQARTELIKFGRPDLTRVLSQRDYRDKYADKGDPYRTRTPMGNKVLVEDQQQIFFFAEGKSATDTRPFVDGYNPYNDQVERVFTSTPGQMERPVIIRQHGLVLMRESAQNAPHYVFKSAAEGMPDRVLYQSKTTEKVSYAPKVLNYQREDGLKLQGTLHLPYEYDPNAQPDKKLAAVLWIYPREFDNKKLSGQSNVNTAQYRDFNPSGPLPFLHDGIAVFESPSMPIVAEGEGEPNDQFIAQLIMNAEAAVKALEKTGQIDIERLAVMGHSYGAFATANLLAHTDLFKAGIAKSGAYNRTLTPFGFQGEQRNLWQAKDSYLQMSPFLYADKINEPLLLIHGENDLNPGTFPMQSKRMYRALVANDKTAKLMLLPYEGHHYQAKENLQQVLSAQSDWLKRWLLEPQS